jgi:hypothetical protein
MKEPEDFLQAELRRGLARQAKLAERQKLARVAFGILREVQDRTELHHGGLVVGRPGVNLGPAADRLRELATSVFDLGKEAQRIEILDVLIEHIGDDELGIIQPSEGDEHLAMRQARFRGERIGHHA